MVKDVLSPEIKTPSGLQKLSDKFLGTNYVNSINTVNDYNLQKAVNVNKYSWNLEGMKAAGINPIAAGASALSSNTGSQASSNSSGDLGALGNEAFSFVKDVLKTANPANAIKELKNVIKYIK